MKNTRWSSFTGKDVEALTSEDAIVKGGLDWNVKQSPAFYNLNGNMVPVPHTLVNYREDTGHAFGTVSDGYHLFQNRQGFQFLDGAVGAAEGMYTNVGSFKDGAKVYIQAKLPGYLRFDGGDDIGEKLLTFITSHDGSLAVSVLFTPVRIVCQNTLNAALRSNTRKTSVRHTMNMAAGLNEARETLGILNAQFSLLESMSRKLSVTPFKDADIPQLVEKSGLVPATADKSTRAQNIIDDVMRRFHYGNGAELKSAKGTAWGAYNAVVEYVDHFRGKDGAKRAESSILGSGAAVKEKAFALLTA